jgi:hypothetical protein
MRDPADRPTTNVHRSRGQGMMLRGIDPTASAGSSVEWSLSTPGATGAMGMGGPMMGGGAMGGQGA